MVLELLFYHCAFLDPSLNRPILSAEDRKRRDRRTPRLALRRYSESSFVYLFKSGCDQALLNCCGVDHKVFQQLVTLFAPVFNRYTFDKNTGIIRKLKLTKYGNRQGRKRGIDATGCLGLVLYWFRTRGSVARAICMAFGVTSTPMYLWLKFSRRVLLFVLQNNSVAKITDPTTDEINEYIRAIGRKYPILLEERVWGACDGLKLLLEQCTNWSIQNRFYNGWTSDTYVNSVFVFAPDGRIRIATINAPGSWHDSQMADYGVYQKMEELYNKHGAKVVVDSAFNLTSNPFLVKSSQKDPIGEPQGVTKNRASTSVRQLSEHGMRMLQGQNPRLKDCMRFEELEKER